MFSVVKITLRLKRIEIANELVTIDFVSWELFIPRSLRLHGRRIPTITAGTLGPVRAGEEEVKKNLPWLIKCFKLLQ